MKKIKNYIDFKNEYDIENFYVGSDAKIKKGEHSKKVEEIALIISKEDENVDKELLSVCALMHDVGRILQYELTNNYDDKIISHRALGIMLVDDYMSKNKIPACKEFDILRLSIGYHGALNLIFEQNDEYQKYVEYVSDADNIHNGCFSCIYYIPYEIENDYKNYIKNNPRINQKEIKPEVIKFIKNHEGFTKSAYVQTYAEYIAYALSLAILMCDKYGDRVVNLMKQKNGKFSSSFAGYEDMINKFVEEDSAKILLNEINKITSGVKD